MIAELDAQVEEMMAPFRPQRDLLDQHPRYRTASLGRDRVGIGA